MAARISLPMPWPWCATPSHDPVSNVRVTWNELAIIPCTPTSVPSAHTENGSSHASSVHPDQQRQ